MDGPVTHQKDWRVRPTAVATERFVVSAMPIGHKLDVSRPAA
jgi:hypothetical protein